MELYHVGFEIIKDIDLKYGRKNADFGQGFYLSNDLSFSSKWAILKDGKDTILNIYDLDIKDLKIKEFKDRDKEWFNYIFKNRNVFPDIYEDYDLIIGPIAIDTIYNLYGILTSGLIGDDTALRILNEGPLFHQIVIKSEKAKEKLKFKKYEVLPKDLIIKNQKEIRILEEELQEKAFSLLNDDLKDMLS